MTKKLVSRAGALGWLLVVMGACSPVVPTADVVADRATSDGRDAPDARESPDASALDATPLDVVDSAVADAVVSMDSVSPLDVASDVGSSDASDSGSSADSATDGAADSAADVAVADGGVPLGALSSEIASSVCGALFRCCPTAQDLATYFGPYVASSRLESLRGRFPPNAPMASFDEGACRAVLRDAFAIVPWADWISAASAGRVGYDGVAAERCSSALRTATCGKPVWDALVDPRCFGFAPGTGDVQRSFFRRTQTTGACSFLRDGTGGVFFGTCDPTQSFCCYESGGRCTVVPGSMLPGVMGTCRPAAAVGEACTIAPALRVCRTGLECDGSSRCVAPRTAMLAIGASCWNASDGLLGDCPSGAFCDLFGSSRCEPRRAQSVACSGGDQCLSEFCQCPASGCTTSSEGGFVEAGRCAMWGLCNGR